jgi:hypothetical protein
MSETHQILDLSLRREDGGKAERNIISILMKTIFFSRPFQPKRPNHSSQRKTTEQLPGFPGANVYNNKMLAKWFKLKLPLLISYKPLFFIF